MRWGLQLVEGLRTSLCPGEGADRPSKPVSSAHVHAQNHFPMGQILLLPRAWCRGLPVLWSRHEQHQASNQLGLGLSWAT